MNGEIHNPKSLLRWQGEQRRIGITGGIASGKSSVGEFLQEVKKIPILDADVFAREALAPGQPSTISILDRYGDLVKAQTTTNKPSINRAALSEIIFTDPDERFWIEQLVHPIVQKRLNQALDSKKQFPIIALIIPLLFEADFTSLCSEIWVVCCTKMQQYKRLIKRDKVSAYAAKQRIESQWSLTKKSHLADVVIDNSGVSKAWLKQVDKLC